MRLVVVSDSHRAMGNLFEIIEMHKSTADKFIFLGDIDDDFDSVLSVYPMLRYHRVAGNNDWHSLFPAQKLIEEDGKRILIAHGHTYRVKFGYETIIREAKRCHADICLFGHTHTQYTGYDDGLYIMNPGAVCSDEYGMVDITESGIMLIPARL